MVEGKQKKTKIITNKNKTLFSDKEVHFIQKIFRDRVVLEASLKQDIRKNM